MNKASRSDQLYQKQHRPDHPDGVAQENGVKHAGPVSRTGMRDDFLSLDRRVARA
ncbi:MAG: hypothetical protein AB8F26_09090 [Phycisphaerales bacterium]